MPKKKAKEGKPEVHKDLEGLDMTVNQFGEIKTTLDFDKINDFLNKNLEDKKFKEKDKKKED
jgi:hypothetical protein